jgi:tetratricopeptide (TPR) repeat protein
VATTVSGRLESARLALSQGKFEQAAKLLALCSKRGKPTSAQRVTISEYWTWLGDDLRALKILGPPLSPNELETLEERNLVIELRKAYILAMGGARYLGLYLFDSIIELIKSPLEDIYPQAFQNRGYLHLSAGNFEKAEKFFLRALELYQPEDHQYFFITLGLHDCRLALGKYSEAYEILSKLPAHYSEQGDEKNLPSTLKAIYFQVKGENLQYQGKFKDAQALLEEAIKLFGSQENKDRAYAHKHLGVALLNQNKKESALEQLNISESLLLKKLATPMAIQEVYFWKYLCSEKGQTDKTLEPQQEVSLYCHPSFGLLSSKLRGDNQIKAAQWMDEATQGLIQNKGGIFIQGQKLQQCDYETILKKKQEESLDWLDLYSGRLILNNTTTLLDETTSYCLMALIGAGLLGVTEGLLLDFIFRQRFTRYEAAQDKLKKTIKKISKMGFQIERSKNTYFYNGYKLELGVYLPFKNSGIGPINLIKNLYPLGFSNPDLKKSLDLSTRGAQRLSKDWYDSGKVFKENPTFYKYL